MDNVLIVNLLLGYHAYDYNDIPAYLDIFVAARNRK